MTVSDFQRLFQYDGWANAQVVARLGDLANAPLRCMRWMGHVIAAEALWLARLKKLQPPVPVWPEFFDDRRSRPPRFIVDDVVALLARTPATLDALLRGLPNTWTTRNEGRDTWTATDIVAHLIDGERNDWIPRVRMIMQHGNTRTFVPFEMSGYLKERDEKTLTHLLDEFARLRLENVAQLRALNLRARDLQRRGRHPELGPVTLLQLLTTWAAHDLTHLHQLSRVMAQQYREAVGPWRVYLGVMQCAGHSTK